MTKFILFRSSLEQDNNKNNFGVVLENGTLICMCCGGIYGEEKYEVLEEIPWEEVWITLNNWL